MIPLINLTAPLYCRSQVLNAFGTFIADWDLSLIWNGWLTLLRSYSRNIHVLQPSTQWMRLNCTMIYFPFISDGYNDTMSLQNNSLLVTWLALRPKYLCKITEIYVHRVSHILLQSKSNGVIVQIEHAHCKQMILPNLHVPSYAHIAFAIEKSRLSLG